MERQLPITVGVRLRIASVGSADGTVADRAFTDLVRMQTAGWIGESPAAIFGSAGLNL